MEWNEFIDWVKPVAEEICGQYDLPVACLLSQAAIESAWGNAKIGEFNLFGRKAVQGDKSIILETSECYNGIWKTIFAPFKDYDSLDEAVDDWCQLMEWGPYKEYADQYHQDHDLEAFVRGIASVYATDPEYGDKIMQTINACSLAGE